MICPNCRAEYVLESPVVAEIWLDLTCPTCGQKFQGMLRRLQDNPRVMCPNSNCPDHGKEPIYIDFRDSRDNENTTKFGEVKISQSARGSIAISLEVYHEKLGERRLIRGSDFEVVKAKAFQQVAKWNEAWAKNVAAERHKEEEAHRTAEAQRALQALRDVLSSSLADSKAVDWEALKDKTPFPRPVPAAPERPSRPEQDPIPEAPSRTSPQYQPENGLLDRFIKSRRVEKENRKARIF